MPETPAIPTNERILDAGIRLWDLEATSLLTGGLTVARIATEAGVTRSTFYSYWPSVDDYLVDLVDHLGNRYHSGRLEEMSEHVVTSDPAIGDTVSRFLDACREHFLLTVDDPMSRLRLGLLAMHDDRTTERLAAVMRTSEEQLDQQYAQVRRTWGRVMREPITASHLQIIFTSLIDGLAIRRRVDPESVPDDLYGLVAMCLMIFITRRADDPRDLFALFDTVNGWPITGAQLQARLERDDPFQPPDIDPASTREIATVARRLTARSGWTELSLADVSAITGAPELALLHAFGSKAGLALGVIRLELEEFYAEIPEHDAAIDELRALLDVSKVQIQRSPAMALNMMSLMTGSSAAPLPGVIDWSPEWRIEDTIRRCIEQGTLHPVDPSALRRLLLRVILTENAGPAAGPALGQPANSLDAIELVLQGAGAPPLSGDERRVPSPG